MSSQPKQNSNQIQRLTWEEPCITLERSLETRAQETMPREPWSGPILGPLSASGGSGTCLPPTP